MNQTITKRTTDGGFRENTAEERNGPPVLRIFERQVLVFPLLVVLLACMSFLWGGKCSAWQWWTAAGLVAGLPFLAKNGWKRTLGSAALFAGVLLALKCLLPPLLWDSTEAPDMSTYHLPMAQLLIEGWNPVKTPLVEGFVKGLGLDAWGMSPILVSYYNKTMAVFAAEAYQFVRDPTALTFPGLVFLWLGVFLQATRLFKGWTRWAAWAAMVLILPLVPHRLPVDQEIAFAALGLLLSMQNALRSEKCDWLSLTVWGAWMMNLKHNGVLGAFVFCALFVAAKCWRERAQWPCWLGRFAVWGTGLVMLWGMISWSPLVTSWQAYGHPLYPFKTAHPDRFPVQDPTWELQGNEDARAMGKAGALVHAYLTPRWTVAFFREKLGKDGFAPQRLWWNWAELPNARARLALGLMFACLFVFRSGRLWGLGGLLLLMLVPTHLVGFVRYQPWLSSLGCLAVICAAEWAEQKLADSRATIGVAACMALGFGLLALWWGWNHARDVEFKSREMALKRDRIRPDLQWPYGPPPENYQQALQSENFAPRYNYLTCMSNRSRLLARRLWGTGQTKVLSPAGLVPGKTTDLDWDERNWPGGGGADGTGYAGMEVVPWKMAGDRNGVEESPAVETWMATPFGYWVPADESSLHVVRYFTEANRRKSGTDADSMAHRIGCVAKTWSVTYPREVWKCLCGRAS